MPSHNPDTPRQMTAEEFDALFDSGEDISPWLDLDSAIWCKPGRPARWAKTGKLVEWHEVSPERAEALGLNPPSNLPDARTRRLIESLLQASWRVNYAGQLWPVRVFVAGDRLAGETLSETTLVLFGTDSKPAHRFTIEDAEAIAGLTNGAPDN
jgi:hypothetical protein